MVPMNCWFTAVPPTEMLLPLVNQTEELPLVRIALQTGAKEVPVLTSSWLSEELKIINPVAGEAMALRSAEERRGRRNPADVEVRSSSADGWGCRVPNPMCPWASTIGPLAGWAESWRVATTRMVVNNISDSREQLCIAICRVQSKECQPRTSVLTAGMVGRLFGMPK